MEYREIGTPKQHAEYLVDLFWSCVENGGMQLLMAKKCAELAVETLARHQVDRYTPSYWEKVLQEIKELK